MDWGVPSRLAGGLRSLCAFAGGGPRFWRNLLAMGRANILGKGLLFLASPLLSRLYSPEDFAALAMFVVALAFLSAFSTGRLDWSIPNARTARSAAALSVLGAVSLVVTSAAASLALALGAASPRLWAGFGILGGLAALLPAAMLAEGAGLILQRWHARSNDLAPVGRSQLLDSAANAGLSLAGGAAALGAPALAGARVLAAWLRLAPLLPEARPMAAILPSLGADDLRAALRSHGGEAAWSVFVSLVNTAAALAPLALFAQFYSSREVGWYALMASTAGGAVSVLASALGESFWAEAALRAREGRVGDLRRMYLRTTGLLLLLSVPVVLACLLGPWMVGPLFGRSQWAEAGGVLLAMAPMLAGTLVFSPTNHLIVLSMQGMQAVGDSVKLALVVASIAAARRWGLSFPAAVALASASSLAGHLLMFGAHLVGHRLRARRPPEAPRRPSAPLV